MRDLTPLVMPNARGRLRSREAVAGRSEQAEPLFRVRALEQLGQQFREALKREADRD